MRRQSKIDPSQYPSASRTTDQPRKLAQVTTGAVKTKSKSGLAFDMRAIGNSLFESTLVPAFMTMLQDFFHGGLDMIFQNLRGGPSQTPRFGGHTSYGQQYRRPVQQVRTVRPQVQQPHYVQNPPPNVLKESYFVERQDAEVTLGSMMNVCAEYNFVTVGDFNTLAGLQIGPNDERWGWSSLQGTQVMLNPSEGYFINFPELIYRD